jgi:folate-binding protein YgfZ
MSQLDHIPLFRLRAIAVTGPDAISFMQSQLTIDVAAIADSRLHPTAWCSPDGRADSVLLIGVDGDRTWLVLPEALVASTLKRARMFSIGRKVALEQDVAAYPAVAPASQGQRAFKLALDSDRSLQLGEPGDGAANEADGLPDDWLQADIECTMPWILPETTRAYLPQMLGLEALGGVSYNKGCFPGQEVIARVHYRGRVTRRTVRFRLAADSPPPPGREFELGGKPAQVLYAVNETEKPGHVIGLAVVAAEAEDGAKIDVGSSSGVLF